MSKVIICPYVTPPMKCYFDEETCKPPCPVLVVTNRKRCSMRKRTESSAHATEDRKRGELEMTQNNELEKMSFEELITWVQSVNWEEVTSQEWEVYESRCKELAKKYFWNKDISQLEEFYRNYAGENIDPWFEAWADSIRNTFPLSELYEKIATMENSLEVLLKQMDKEPANITVGQLNRLKRGI